MTASSVGRMLPSSARRRRPAVVVAGLLASALVLGGCSDEEQRAAPEPEPRPIDERIDTENKVWPAP